MPVTMDQLDMRWRIQCLEQALRTIDLTDTDLEIITDTHPLAQPRWHRTAGIWVREMHFRAGSMYVGKRHAQEHICTIASGKVMVTTEHGTQAMGPCTFVSPAGSKKAIWVVEDLVWINVHRSDAEDPQSLEAELIMKELPWVG